LGGWGGSRGNAEEIRKYSTNFETGFILISFRKYCFLLSAKSVLPLAQHPPLIFNAPLGLVPCNYFVTSINKKVFSPSPKNEYSGREGAKGGVILKMSRSLEN